MDREPVPGAVSYDTEVAPVKRKERLRRFQTDCWQMNVSQYWWQRADDRQFPVAQLHLVNEWSRSDQHPRSRDR